MAESVNYKLEKNSFGGVYKLQYLGVAASGVADDTHKWTIYKFSYGDPGDGSLSLQRIEVLNGVAWNDRATLPWP